MRDKFVDVTDNKRTEEFVDFEKFGLLALFFDQDFVVDQIYYFGCECF